MFECVLEFFLVCIVVFGVWCGFCFGVGIVVGECDLFGL